MIHTYGKALVALLFAALTVLASALTDGHVTPAEGIQIAISVATAAGVWLAPNLPRWPGVKTALAALLAALNLAVTLIDGGLTSAEVANLVIAGLAVLGVGVTPAQSTPPVPVAPLRQ